MAEGSDGTARAAFGGWWVADGRVAVTSGLFSGEGDKWAATRACFLLAWAVLCVDRAGAGPDAGPGSGGVGT